MTLAARSKTWVNGDVLTAGDLNGEINIVRTGVSDHEGASANIHGVTGNVVGTTDTQTLTNKSLTAPVLTTPQINDASADHQYVFAVSELAADRTVTLPLLAGNDVFVFADFTQTLTNKTLTAPVLSGTVTGTYTLGGTPTVTAPILSGTVTGTYTLGGTPTITAPVLSGTVTGTYTLGGTPSLPAVSGNVAFDTDTLFVDATNNRVGVGIASPSTALHVYSSGTTRARIEAPSGQTAGVFIISNGNADGWTIRGSAAATSDLEIFADSVQRATWKNNGELLLTAVDPPTANYMNRNSSAKAWLRYTDNSGVVTNSYNIESVGDDDGDGLYEIYWDTNFASTEYVVTGLAEGGSDRAVMGSGTYTALYKTIKVVTTSTGSAVDSDFCVVAHGVQ